LFGDECGPDYHKLLWSRSYDLGQFAVRISSHPESYFNGTYRSGNNFGSVNASLNINYELDNEAIDKIADKTKLDTSSFTGVKSGILKVKTDFDSRKSGISPGSIVIANRVSEWSIKKVVSNAGNGSKSAQTALRETCDDC
jgi:hypothetical protein